MINVITPLLSTVPASTASVEMDGDAAFSSLLEKQLAVATDELAPEEGIPEEVELVSSNQLDEEGEEAAALWLASVGPEEMAAPMALTLAASAVATPQTLGATCAEAMLNHQDKALPKPDWLTHATPQTVRHNAAAEMLQMIASPQADHKNPQAAELPQRHHQAEPALLLKTQSIRIESLQSGAQATAPSAEPQAPTMLLASAPVFSPVSLSTPVVALPVANSMLPVAHATLEPTVGSPAWQQALGQQLSSFTRQGVHHAELRLHPENLGPLKVNLRLNQDQVQLHFVTDQHPVRAALEAAMPHLRATLAESGIQLEQGSVGSDAPGWDSASDSSSGQPSHSQREDNVSVTSEVEEDIQPVIIDSRMGINTFA